MLLIPNATNNLTKSIFFHLHIQEISKVDDKKTLDRHMLYETCTHIYNKHMLIAQDCFKFWICIAWQFPLNSFANFSDVVQVKKSPFRSVVGGVSI